MFDLYISFSSVLSIIDDVSRTYKVCDLILNEWRNGRHVDRSYYANASEH